MLSEKIQKALCTQLNAEFEAAYLYLAMSNFFVDKGLSGFASWMRAQSKEETEHAIKLMEYIQSQGNKVELMPIKGNSGSWNSILEVFKDTLKSEIEVTGYIHQLMDLAIAEKDYATQSILQWYVDEQVEEVNTATGIVQALEFLGDDKVGMFMLNKELNRG